MHVGMSQYETDDYTFFNNTYLPMYGAHACSLSITQLMQGNFLANARTEDVYMYTEPRWMEGELYTGQLDAYTHHVF